MRIIDFVTDVGSIQRILAYLGEPTQAPDIAPANRGLAPFEEDSEPRKGTDLSERAASESQGQGVALLGAAGRNDRTSPSNPGMDALRPYPSSSSISG